MMMILQLNVIIVKIINQDYELPTFNRSNNKSSRILYYRSFQTLLKYLAKGYSGASKIGFNFIFTNTKKKDLASEITGRVEQLITKIKEKFTKTLDIKIVSLDLIDETKVKLVISVNQVESDDILVDINETTG